MSIGRNFSPAAPEGEIFKKFRLRRHRGKSSKKIRLVKGSHIILNKIYDQKIAFTFQNNDKRIVFAIPYKDKFTLVLLIDPGVTNNSKTKRIKEFTVQFTFFDYNEYKSKKN